MIDCLKRKLKRCSFYFSFITFLLHVQCWDFDSVDYLEIQILRSENLGTWPRVCSTSSYVVCDKYVCCVVVLLVVEKCVFVLLEISRDSSNLFHLLFYRAKYKRTEINMVVSMYYDASFLFNESSVACFLQIVDFRFQNFKLNSRTI